MRLPIGYSDFRKIIDLGLHFVDKSLLIKEVLNDGEVILITRPRRFGKTLNLSMLRYFFAAEVDGLPTQDLFNHLKIMQAGSEHLQHQGKYPVIFLTLKDIKETTFDGAYALLCKLMSRLYTEYHFLLKSPKLYDHEKEVYESILKQQPTSSSLTTSLQDLTNYLYRHYGVKPLLLIDEYDTPIQSGYLHGFYEQIVSFFRNFFGAALKDNPYLFKAVLTGILRVSRESLFSGLNNLKVYSVLHSKYSTYFGFTEKEVSDLLNQTSFKDKALEIKHWYNGYQIGDHTLYNPWSIVNCIQENGLLKPYWVNTSDNTLIKTLLLKSSTTFKEQFESLLQEKPIERLINENFVFSDLRNNNESAAWSLLLTAGYLKVISYRNTDQGPLCQLAIPNHEIRNLYRGIIEEWLSSGYGVEWYNRFLQHLLDGDITAFEKDLKHILEQTVSVHDVAKEPEAFYHGLMIGLTASLYGEPHYEIKSNHESGYGRYDYLILARDPEKLTILLEFKKVNSIENRKPPEEHAAILKKAALEALKQIDDRAYLAEIQQRGQRKLLKIGIAFCGKRFAIAHERLDHN